MSQASWDRPHACGGGIRVCFPSGPEGVGVLPSLGSTRAPAFRPSPACAPAPLHRCDRNCLASSRCRPWGSALGSDGEGGCWSGGRVCGRQDACRRAFWRAASAVWRWWSRAPRGCPGDGEGRLMSWCHGTSPGLEASLVRLPVVSLQPVCLRVVLAARSLLSRHCFSGASPQGQHALFPSLHPSFPPVCQRATLLWSM